MAGSKFQYDESGGTFFYFLLSFLALILIPASYYFWPKGSKQDKDQTKSVRKCHCELCLLKQNRLTSKEPQKKVKRRLTKLLIVFGWVVFAAIAYKVAHLERDHVDWDPFDILQIDRGASQSEIKRAYRKLSLVYHPDKDTGDAKKFLQLTKAHAALTDDEARKNWEMYGNPDGPGAMSFGIALPSWIVEKENSLWVLGLYALVFMVTLPTVVGIWWHRSIKFGEHQVLMETTRMYYYFVHRTAHMNIRRLLMILSASFEFCKHHNSEIVERPSDNFEVPTLFKNFVNFGEKNKEPPLFFAYSLKARALVFAHLSRIELNPATLAIDKMYVVKKCPFLIHEMVQSIYQMLTLSVSGHFRQMPLVETLDMLENCMRLSPMIVQALWEKKSALLQLPHIKEDMLRHFMTKTRHIRSVSNLVRMKRADRRLLLQTLTDEEYDDVMSVCGQMPYVEITAKAEVLGDVDPSTITIGAVVTVTVTLKRRNMSDFFEQETVEYSDDKEIPTNKEDEEEVDVEQKKQPVWRKQKKKSKGGKANKKKGTSKQYNHSRKRQNPNEVKPGTQTSDEKEKTKTKRVGKEGVNEHQDGDGSDASSKESDLDSDVNDDSNEENSKEASESDEGDDQLWKETQVMRGKKEKTMESRSRVSHTAHCPYFPEEKQEYWWIYIVDRKLRYIMTAPFHITDLVDETEVQLKFPAPDNVGLRQYTIHLRSDSYVDSDVTLVLKLDVKEAKIISPEDLKYGISEDEKEDEDSDDNDKDLSSDDDAVAISDDSDTD